MPIPAQEFRLTTRRSENKKQQLGIVQFKEFNPTAFPSVIHRPKPTITKAPNQVRNAGRLKIQPLLNVFSLHNSRMMSTRSRMGVFTHKGLTGMSLEVDDDSRTYCSEYYSGMRALNEEKKNRLYSM